MLKPCYPSLTSIRSSSELSTQQLVSGQARPDLFLICVPLAPGSVMTGHCRQLLSIQHPSGMAGFPAHDGDRYECMTTHLSTRWCLTALYSNDCLVLFSFLHMRACVCVSVWYMGGKYPHRLGEGTSSLGAGVTGICELLHWVARV